MTLPVVPATAEEQRAALEKEWSTYVAVVPIYVDGARAFNVGDAVPVSHVDGKVVPAEYVAKTTTKAGQAAAGQTEKG